MEKKLSKEIIVALIGAAAVILAALIALVPRPQFILRMLMSGS